MSQQEIVKMAKSPLFRFQSRSRSSILVHLKSSLAVLVTVSSKSVPIFNRFYAWS